MTRKIIINLSLYIYMFNFTNFTTVNNLVTRYKDVDHHILHYTDNQLYILISAHHSLVY